MTSRKMILTALAAAGLAATSPALGQLIGGSGGVGVGVGAGGPGVGVGTVTRGNADVGVGHRVDTNVGVDARTNTRIERDRRHRARHRHNDSDGFVGAGVAGAIGLHTGMVVRDSFGATVGTISRINASSDGTIRSVLVARADGNGAVRLSPGALDVHSSGHFATTSAIRARRGHRGD